MLRHEYIFQYEAPAPGAFESEHVPVVFDGDLGHRDKKIALIAAILRVAAERTDETPLGMALNEHSICDYAALQPAKLQGSAVPHIGIPAR